MKSTNKQNLVLGIVAIAIMVGIAWVSLRGTDDSSDDSAAISKSSEVLSPALFDDERTRAAYQTAKDIPDVLDQLPCFCGCMTSFGHKNNLFCFKDQHGSGCTLCQDIALDARKMHDQGMPIAQIQESIKAKYSKYQP
ncbi:MAG TPA: CYCXC family (seleno)protein [Pyrinomonadaceae bacterium]|nr:CYCXC family (seleno)protein [Pyrinomonadaceae bacterium]